MMDEIVIELTDVPATETLAGQRFRDACAAQQRLAADRERAARANAARLPTVTAGGPAVVDPTTGRVMSAQEWWARGSKP